MPTPRLQTGDLVLRFAMPQYGSSPEHTVRSARPSAVTTTGFTDPNVDATWVGCLVVPENGPLKEQVRQIVSFSATTVTLDAPWVGSTTGSTAFRIYQSAEVPFRVTTADAAGPFDVISSPHAAVANEPDAFWDGHSLIGKSGANAGMSKPISGFTTAAGTVPAGANAATAIGDLFLARQMVRPAEPITASVNPKVMSRTSVGTGEQGGDMPMILGNEGSMSVVFEQRPLVTPGVAAVQAVAPVELGAQLRDAFTQTRDTGGAITAITSTTVTTSNGVFSVNGFALLHNGKAVHVLATSGAGAVITYGSAQAGTTTQVPIASAAISSVHYQRKTTDWRHCGWDLYRGGKVRQLLLGCMGNTNIAIDRENTIKFAFEYTVAEPWQYNIDRPVALGAAFPLAISDYGVPTDGKGARCLIGSTAVVVQSISLNAGLIPNLRPSLSGAQQNEGSWMNIEHPTGMIKVYADSDDTVGFKSVRDQLHAGVPQQFLFQKGTASGNTACLGIPAMAWTGGPFEYDNGQGCFTMAFQCVTPQLAVDALGAQMYPVATFPGLREFSYGQC